MTSHSGSSGLSAPQDTGHWEGPVPGQREVSHRVGELDRAKVRRQFDRRFTARRMAQDYLDLYGELCQPLAPRLHAVAG
jgi:hypothetical protein